MSTPPGVSPRWGNLLPPSKMGEARHLPLLAFLASLSAFCRWIMPIGSSLWLDELVTFWSAYKGIVPALGRAQFWPGQTRLIRF